MYKIKEFSDITNTSIVTLRYYDEIGLFKPNYVDLYSGYRYYNDNQINIIQKINLLKKFGLSLDEIKEYLNTNNEEILIKKMKGYEEMMNEIKDFLDNEDKKQYKIIKSNYNKYLELNGLLNSRCAMAIEVKNNNADYYYIEENNEIKDDFVIYRENKVLTLKQNNYNNKELIKSIFKKVKKDYDEIYIIIPIEEEIIEIEDYKNNYEIIKQGIYEYKKIKFNL